MTAAIRVALLDASGGEHARAAAEALDDAMLVRARGVRVAERVLRQRGFAAGLTEIPTILATLACGGFDVAHAFTPLDAVAALEWRRRAGRPVVFTCAEPIGRENVADRRLRLWTLRRAVEESDALLATDDGVRTGLERWFGASARVIAAGDGDGLERLYLDLLARDSG